jgi:hypothetical protein
MSDVDVLLSQIARAEGIAAAMIDTATRELDAIEEHPVSQRDSDKN